MPADLAGAGAFPARLRVGVAFSPAAGRVDETELSMTPGATVADALRSSGVQARHPSIEIAALRVGVWGVACTLDQPLRDRDRVEVWRPLAIDPKEARRRRQQVQATGQRRPRGRTAAAAEVTPPDAASLAKGPSHPS